MSFFQEKIMQDSLFSATLALLADGAVIEQTASAPLTFRILYQGASVPLSGGIVQRLRIGQHIREVCAVNGRKRFYPR